MAKFHLSRSVGFHMVQTYIPSILIVVISWVSFWMDVDSVAGRTTLGVTTLLTVSSKSAGKSDANSAAERRWMRRNLCLFTESPLVFPSDNAGVRLYRDGERMVPRLRDSRVMVSFGLPQSLARVDRLGCEKLVQNISTRGRAEE